MPWSRGGMVARGVCHALCSPLRGSPPGALVRLRGAPADTSECTIGHPRWSSGEETMNAKHCSRMVREGERVAEAVFAVPVAEADVTLTQSHTSTQDALRHPRASAGLAVS